MGAHRSTRPLRSVPQVTVSFAKARALSIATKSGSYRWKARCANCEADGKPEHTSAIVSTKGEATKFADAHNEEKHGDLVLPG